MGSKSTDSGEHRSSGVIGIYSGVMSKGQGGVISLICMSVCTVYTEIRI